MRSKDYTDYAKHLDNDLLGLIPRRKRKPRR